MRWTFRFGLIVVIGVAPGCSDLASPGAGTLSVQAEKSGVTDPADVRLNGGAVAEVSCDDEVRGGGVLNEDRLKPELQQEPGPGNSSSVRTGSDWAEFLGPHGTGISDEVGLADQWPQDGPPVLWDRRIGKGYSSPSVIGGEYVSVS